MVLMFFSDLPSISHLILIIPNTSVSQINKNQTALLFYKKTPPDYFRSDVFNLYVELHYNYGQLLTPNII